MPAGKLDLVWEQGTTVVKQMTWLEPPPDPEEPEVFGPPVDLTGWTARMQVRQKLDSTNVLAEFTTENGGITLGADGTIVIRAEALASAAWTWPGKGSTRKAVYDLELMDPGGVVLRFVEGRITLKMEVTRDA
jgi:hypothetical protein